MKNLTREMVLDASLDIVRRDGIRALDLKALASELHVTQKNILAAITSMEDVLEQIRLRARSLFDSYIREGLSMTPPFKGFAMQFIAFASNEKELFKWMFLTPGNFTSLDGLISYVGFADEILDAVAGTFNLDHDTAYRLYRDLWSTSFAIATMCSCCEVEFSPEDYSTMLGQTCRNMLIGLKIGNDPRMGIVPGQGNTVRESAIDYINDGMEVIREQNTSRLMSILIDQDKLVHSMRWLPKYLSDADWEYLFSLVDKVYARFSERLKERFPDITHTEMRLCILLKLDFPVKSMAAMMGISPSSVTKGKQRLKTRFGGENLESVISSL